MSQKFLTKRTGNQREREVRTTHTQRRSITKSKNNNNNVRAKDWGPSIIAHFGAENIDIENIFGPRSSNKLNKKGSPLVSEIKKKSELIGDASKWYSIRVANGNKYDRRFLEETLLTALFPLPFWPIGWKAFGANVTFHVDDYEVARNLRALDGDIEMPDGFKLILEVIARTPKVKMCQYIKLKLKSAIMNRYNAGNKALDLSNFHYDPILKDIPCPLSVPSVLIAVIHIIGENIPELEALNLNDNRIQNLCFVSEFIAKLENVKILHLARNKIRDIITIDALIPLPLVELLLTDNPICYLLRGNGLLRYDYFRVVDFIRLMGMLRF